MLRLVKSALTLFIILPSFTVFAELKELDDKKLDDQKAKAGITIDLETQLSIGEMYFDMNNRNGKDKLRKNYMPEQKVLRTYDLPKSNR